MYSVSVYIGWLKELFHLECLSVYRLNQSFHQYLFYRICFNQCHIIRIKYVPKLHVPDNNTQLVQHVPSSPQYFLHGCEV